MLKNRLQIKTILLLVLIQYSSKSQSPLIEDAPPVFTIEALQSDFQYVRNRLEARNPILYLYHSKETMDRYLDSTYASIDQPMPELDFVPLIAQVMAFTGDGHNTAIPSESAINIVRDNPHLLPLDIRFYEQKGYLVRNLSHTDDLMLGVEIARINQVPVAQIWQNILPLMPADGKGSQWTESNANNSFRFYYHMLYGFSESYLIEYYSANQVSQQYTVKGEPLLTIETLKKERYGTPQGTKSLRMELFDTLHTAVITIKTFEKSAIRKASKQHFKREIARYFKTIKMQKVTTLVIDIRNNSGGNPDYVKAMLRRLFQKPFRQARVCRIVQHKHKADFFERTRRQWYPWYGIGTFRPARNYFDGKLYVLINDGTFSASVQLAGALQNYGRATFIGTETGGNSTIMSGFLTKTNWTLPNTKIQISSGTLCTLYKKFASNTGRGILPDITVSPSPADIISGEDRHLKTAFSQIKNDGIGH